MARYNLKETKANDKTLVNLRAKIRGKEFKYSLGATMKVHPKDWDFEKQCYKSTVKDASKKNKFQYS